MPNERLDFTSMSPSHNSDEEDREGVSQRSKDRPPYTLEEAHSLLFLYNDCGMRWDDAVVVFNRLFPRVTRKKEGLQCKYYRVMNYYFHMRE